MGAPAPVGAGGGRYPAGMPGERGDSVRVTGDIEGWRSEGWQGVWGDARMGGGLRGAKEIRGEVGMGSNGSGRDRGSRVWGEAGMGSSKYGASWMWGRESMGESRDGTV